MKTKKKNKEALYWIFGVLTFLLVIFLLYHFIIAPRYTLLEINKHPTVEVEEPIWVCCSNSLISNSTYEWVVNGTCSCFSKTLGNVCKTVDNSYCTEPEPAIPSDAVCTEGSKAYGNCKDGTTYVMANCVNWQWHPIEFYISPCASHGGTSGTTIK